jgi:hypothetical protein
MAIYIQAMGWYRFLSKSGQSVPWDGTDEKVIGHPMVQMTYQSVPWDGLVNY